jgi:hypothetical protein
MDHREPKSPLQAGLCQRRPNFDPLAAAEC